jgi:pyruvate dehydrogenase E1 component alpha subunit
MPALLECRTYRFLGHSRSDPPHGHYRKRAEVEHWQQRDPLAVLAAAASLDDTTCTHLQAQAQAQVEQAVQFARASAVSGEAELAADVWG